MIGQEDEHNVALLFIFRRLQSKLLYFPEMRSWSRLCYLPVSAFLEARSMDSIFSLVAPIGAPPPKLSISPVKLPLFASI
jgi:hypothetical protein